MNEPDDQSGVPHRRRSDPDDSSRHPLRVFAIDDDASYRAYISYLVRSLKFDVEVAADATSGLKALHEGEFDLLIVDLMMPEIDGIEAIRRARSDPQTRGIYAILLTGKNDLETKIAALDAGFDDFLPKSASEDEMKAKLRSARRLVASQRKLRRQNRELYALSMTDALTGIGNRRLFFDRARILYEAGAKNVTVMLFDLNGFKNINDTYGHLTGDTILSDVGGVFRDATREEDVVARYGGDEFVMLIPGVSADDAGRIALRLSDHIAALKWKAGQETITITASFGMARSEEVEFDIEELLRECDRQLYRSKKKRELTRIPPPAIVSRPPQVR